MYLLYHNPLISSIKSSYQCSLIRYTLHLQNVLRSHLRSLIGCRNASSKGLNLAYQTGKYVAEANLNLINGLALGCDTQAIQGALSANGKCAAILPCSLEQILPKSNQQLAEEIIKKGGCLISEYPIGTTLQKHYYIERDRLQSGLSKGVLVIEAMGNSGTMHTANFALQQAKRLACYYHKLAQNTTGNLSLENAGHVQTIKNNEDLMKLLESLRKEPNYQQLAFNFPDSQESG